MNKTEHETKIINRQERLSTVNKKRLMLNALTKSLGIVVFACKKTGISRTTHYSWMKNDSKYREKVEDIDAVALDFAESALLKLIEKGDVSAIIFFLRTKGKSRGYSEKIKIVYKSPAPKPLNEKNQRNREEVSELIKKYEKLLS